MEVREVVALLSAVGACAGAAYKWREAIKDWWAGRPRKVLSEHVAQESQMETTFGTRLKSVEETVQEIKEDVAYIRGRIDGAAH